jgi:cytochrome oxidase assembly protein ShyY1
VTIEGLLRASGSSQTGVDVDEIAAALDRDLFPLYLQQSAPEPDGEYPILLDPPARDEGPHLSYAVQWFLFTGVVLVGYPILLRRRIRVPARAEEFTGDQ